MRGDRMAMVFQEPMTALNPVMPIGRQIAEVLVLHQALGWRPAGERAVDLLDAVGIPAARDRAASYPHQLSGGQRQRAMIAMALACRPALLIADEPTTALDVTIQAQILNLMADLQAEIGMAIQFISHNLAVVSEIAHEIIVMYAGRIVERAPAEALFAAPLHPYTLGLIATLPDPDRRVERLPVIPGSVPDIRGMPRLPLRRSLRARRTGMPGRPNRCWRNSHQATLSPASTPARYPANDRAGRTRSDQRALQPAWWVVPPAAGAARRRAGQPGDRGRRDARSGRRKRQWQEHDRECGCRTAAADPGRDAVSRPGAGPGNQRLARRAIQIVFQDPFGALDPRMPVSAIIAEPLTINRIGSAAERRAAGSRPGARRRPAARRTEPLPA